MSTPDRNGRAAVRRKGKTAEGFLFAVRRDSGTSQNMCRTVTIVERYHRVYK